MTIMVASSLGCININDLNYELCLEQGLAHSTVNSLALLWCFQKKNKNKTHSLLDLQILAIMRVTFDSTFLFHSSDVTSPLCCWVPVVYCLITLWAPSHYISQTEVFLFFPSSFFLFWVFETISQSFNRPTTKPLVQVKLLILVFPYFIGV